MARFGLIWAAALIGLLCLLIAFLAAILLPSGPQRAPTLQLNPVSFEDLPGWREDDLRGFDRALQKSCAAIQKMPPSKPVPGAKMAGQAGDWAAVCSALAGLSGSPLKAAIEQWFIPHTVSMQGRTSGTFTGYYEPLLSGSLTKSAAYPVPLYTRPDTLVDVDLGQFRSDLKGRRIAGRISGKRLVPFESRKAIGDGALAAEGKPLLWVSDPVDAFFLHIQGSGRVALPDGRLVSVGYAGQNGHPYFPVGRLLIREGHATAQEMSLQFIKGWLKAHPDEQDRVLNANPSYIFFRNLGEVDGPYGSAGVTLTPGRSIAVDRKHLAMHLPIYLVTDHPDPVDPVVGRLPLRRLMMAQDTGGAITGEIRGDVFWGPGADAEVIAGHMNSMGSYFVLLPRPIANASAGPPS